MWPPSSPHTLLKSVRRTELNTIPVELTPTIWHTGIVDAAEEQAVPGRGLRKKEFNGATEDSGCAVLFFRSNWQMAIGN
jgi:hypothetical protein